ncbi:hypothetical protein ACQKNX_01075 [Lysinibacillus sp. NPDC093712]|uniref:hypothetical protein n=1 Tax=Lysinibacillus sp. NPDC093712 TaxID=3390579 RepID=UPI003D014E56
MQNHDDLERDSLINRTDSFFIELLESFNNEKLERLDALVYFESFLWWNEQTHYFSKEQLQKLWMKLIKKYKFTIEQWEKIDANTNIHFYLVKQNGHGLQKLMRFYNDRRALKWKENAFDYGMAMLINIGKMPGLEMFFLTNLICYEWKNDYLKNADVIDFFRHTGNDKVKELYESYRTYDSEQNLLSAMLLVKLLSKYNPQFNIYAAATPDFYKKLSLFVGVK